MWSDNFIRERMERREEEGSDEPKDVEVYYSPEDC